ncbi:hypothetical protein NDU88_004108 [Pleurodeles waltl]|uniref:Uncharacterized protein n=1 Tax=Pleurodeles waltl TaxID=8319 RepID=A0AAV7UG84_PLEWA|nr:hypothetical protein NDU88_004108 [Pleurodeles waltl]
MPYGTLLEYRLYIAEISLLLDVWLFATTQPLHTLPTCLSLSGYWVTTAQAEEHIAASILLHDISVQERRRTVTDPQWHQTVLPALTDCKLQVLIFSNWTPSHLQQLLQVWRFVAEKR